jgi:tetratricopeptide (TPR) repeat protein
MDKVTTLREKPKVEQDIINTLHRYAEHLRAKQIFPSTVTATRRGIAMDPTNPRLWATLGCVYWNMGEYEKAVEPMLKALSLEPKNAAHSGNLGLLHHSLRDYPAAERYFARALELSKGKGRQKKKDKLGSIWDRSLMRLEQGEWASGLQDYETRIELKGAPLYSKMPVPLWKGEPLDGKVLYIQEEQGIGDRILFSRYLPIIKERWPTSRVKICSNEMLLNLFWEFRHLAEFVPTGIPWPDDLDYGVFEASLPLCLGTTPETIPPDPGLLLKRVKHQELLGGFNLPQPVLPSLKVGIAWTGNPEQGKNNQRSIPLEKLLRLAESPGVTLYSFQVGPGSEKLKELETQELVADIGSHLAREGLVAAGVAMRSMDLMITVCTSTAHLAGALGVPTILMLGWDPYWIWLCGDKKPKTTPWYPSISIIQQDTPGDWDGVLRRVMNELEKFPSRQLERNHG